MPTETTTNSTGELQYKIWYPKYKRGDFSVRALKTDPTYGSHTLWPSRSRVWMPDFHYEANISHSKAEVKEKFINTTVHVHHLERYIDTLLELRFQHVENPLPYQHLLQQVYVPPTLYSQYGRPDKTVAVARYKSRFANLEG